LGDKNKKKLKELRWLKLVILKDDFSWFIFY